MMSKKNIVTVCLFWVLSTTCAQAQNVYPSFADLAEKLIPSVVNISTTHDKEDIANEEEELNNHIETTVNSIFNAPLSNKVSLGSGFIIDENGYIVTNNHVIDKAKAISVILADDSVFEAELIGKDAKTDIALIKINTNKKLTPVTFGDSDKIRIGDWILAIGNPFGLGGSVTAGIVSAKSRDIESGPYDNFIQTDASINQGSSGGPMFNMAGELIGVNTAIFSTNGGSMGVGFAIPTNSIKFVIHELKKHGKVDRGWIGIKMQPTTLELNQSLGLSGNKGAIISEVTPNASASKAGIKAGDVILKFDNHEIDNTKNLSRIVAETPIGKKVAVEIWRNKQRQKVELTIEKMPEEKAPQKTIPLQDSEANDVIENEEPNWIIGMNLSEINADLMEKYQLPADTQGLFVLDVQSGSDAEKKGIRKGNIILSIDKRPIVDMTDIQNALQEAKLANNRPVLLQIKAQDQLYFVAVKSLSEEE